MIKILIGLLALGMVVFIHELGHFIVARLCGVTVESFSLGWGPVLFRKKMGDTEYRISALPLGGYCGMKGEHAFREALDNNLDSIPRESGSFYSVHPAKRIAIAFAGPFANLLFSVIALAFVSTAGYTYKTWDNQIIPSSVYDGVSTPADKAGLAEGDRIIRLNGKTVANFSDLQQSIGTHPMEKMQLVYERSGKQFSTTITPDLDKKTGSGKIGVYPFIPLVVASVKQGSAAETTGIKPGDHITGLDGASVNQYMQFAKLLEKKPEQVMVTLDRDGIALNFKLVLLYDSKGNPETGIEWKTISVQVPGSSFPENVRYGITETVRTLSLTLKSLTLLFRGVDLSRAVSGPVRITMMIGEVAQSGLTSLAGFLSIICVSLFLMNLLPIPVLDGGLILFSVLEWIKRKPLKPKTLYYVQFIGIAFILCIFVFSLFGDIHFLMK